MHRAASGDNAQDRGRKGMDRAGACSGRRAQFSTRRQPVTEASSRSCHRACTPQAGYPRLQAWHRRLQAGHLRLQARNPTVAGWATDCCRQKKLRLQAGAPTVAGWPQTWMPQPMTATVARSAGAKCLAASAPAAAVRSSVSQPLACTGLRDGVHRVAGCVQRLEDACPTAPATALY